MNKNSKSTKTGVQSEAFGSVIASTIASGLTPFALKLFAVIDTKVYSIILVIGVLLSAVLFVLWEKTIVKSKKHHIMAFTFTLATALCMIVSANLAKQEDTNKLSVNLDSSFRERHEKNAEGGNVDAMLNLGFYYFNKTNRLLLSAPKKQLRDDEYIDTRDFVKAKRYFEMAAAKNSPEAYVGLGLMTFRGLDCIPSREHALFYFRKAYEKDAHNALLYNVLKLCDISIEEVLGD